MYPRNYNIGASAPRDEAKIDACCVAPPQEADTALAELAHRGAAIANHAWSITTRLEMLLLRMNGGKGDEVAVAMTEGDGIIGVIDATQVRTVNALNVADIFLAAIERLA